MLELTRLNGNPLYINAELMKTVEAAPDTVLTLVTGEKLIVLESPEQVRTKAIHYRAAILRHAWPTASTALEATATHHALGAVDKE